jgi:SAM-dependent methyltransferase
MGYYAKDLSYVHHVGFSDFVRGAAPYVLALLRRSGIRSGRVVELGCGAGELAAVLSQSGYDVLGVDISAAMIALARRSARKARFRKSSLFDVKIPQCNAVVSLGECLNYESNKRITNRDLIQLFRRVYDALSSAGVFLFDVHMCLKPRDMKPTIRPLAGNDWAVLLRVEADRAGTHLTRYITTFRKVGGSYRRSNEVHLLRLYTTTDMMRTLRRIGFRVEVVHRYGRTPLGHSRMGFVARKSV